MNEEKIQGMLIYLAKIGFQSPSLEQNIRDHINIGAIEFRVRHEIVWGNEKMEFSLKLSNDEQFQDYRITDYNATHIDGNGVKNSQVFNSTPLGFCNTNLAYHILSGRLNDLQEKLSYLQLEEFPGIDMYQEIEKMLSKNAESFEFTFHRNEPEGNLELKIPVTKIDSWYHLDTYKAILTPYQSIDHGTYNGIDSALLEKEMRKIDWHDDHELFIFHEHDQPTFKPEVEAIAEQMHRLSQDLVGMGIADQLQLKYWADATFFQDMVSQEAWDNLEELPKRAQNFPVEVEAKTAFNLLCGRPVMLQKTDYSSPEMQQWIKLDFTTVGPEGNFTFNVIPKFSEDELKASLDLLPIRSDHSYSIKMSLQKGDLTSILLPNGKKVILATNPEENTLNILSEDMRPIPVNFQFDPDWKPSKSEGQTISLEQKLTRTNILTPKDFSNKTSRFGRRR